VNACAGFKFKAFIFLCVKWSIVAVIFKIIAANQSFARVVASDSVFGFDTLSLGFLTLCLNTIKRFLAFPPLEEAA
jgi:hypothetical protein